MTSPDKISRTAWIGFVAASVVSVAFCLLNLAVIFLLRGRDDYGGLEGPAPAAGEQWATWFSLVGHPVAWMLGMCFAWMCNRGWLAVIPFAVNLLPALGLLWLASGFAREERGDFGTAAVIYSGAIVALLVTGLAAALPGTCRSRGNENAGPGSDSPALTGM